MADHSFNTGTHEYPQPATPDGDEHREPGPHVKHAAYLSEIAGRVEQLKLADPYLLNGFTVFCINANRMIGSGIFLTPSNLTKLTQSIGISLIFWLAGACTTICGALMFINYGLNSPRFPFVGSGNKHPLPRSGGDLFYLKDIIRKPPFLAVCLYGFSYIFLANIATNSMAFGARILQAAGRTDSSDSWLARGIAIGVVTSTCALHSFWRMGGIHLSNFFGIIKLAMLLLMFILGCLTWGGVFPRDERALSNMTSSSAFKDPSQDPYAFAEAYLSIVFAFGGFNQANYVLGEVRRPKTHYKWPAFLSVVTVCALYLLVNLSYMLVVPAEDQKADTSDVATQFFELTLGAVTSDPKDFAARIVNAFIAISALGNLLVFTFAAARVKQEIAKEGILWPYDFFANRKTFPWAPQNPVPFGALVLHWAVSVFLILATAALPPLKAYDLLVYLYSYAVDAIFGVMLSIGVFILQFNSPSFAAQKSFMPKWLSLVTATLYGLSMAFPVIASWIPPSAGYIRNHAFAVPWYIVPTVSWATVAFGLVWWLGVRYVWPLRYDGKQLVIARDLLINDDGVMDSEHIAISWQPKQFEDSPQIYEDARVEHRGARHDPMMSENA